MVDWERAVERNREALLRIVEALFVMAGLVADDPAAVLPRHAYNRLQRILRPAESAARRLIFIAARGTEVPLLSPRGRESLFPHLRGQGPRKCPEKASDKASDGDGKVETAPAFLLLDPLKDFSPRRRYAKSFPRITCIGMSTPTPIPDNWIPAADDELDIRPLRRRLVALRRALGDLDGQARRLARWKARRDAGLLRAPRSSPMRIGHPPGHRRRPLHEVDDILRECHGLALYARKLDTS